MEKLIPASEGKTYPVFSECVDITWCVVKEDESDIVQQARAIDMSFIVKRRNKQIRPSWSVFNQSLSKKSTESTAITTVGYMPIIQAPAHELDTLNTVVRRCMYISSQLGQEYTVLTVDQALYFKLMDLKWNVADYKDKLILRLGGLHISMNFLKVIGQQVKDCGLAEAWLDAGILGCSTIEHVMMGKAYNKGMRSHKLTFQALWRLLLPELLSFLQRKDANLRDEIEKLTKDDNIDKLMTMLNTAR